MRKVRTALLLGLGVEFSERGGSNMCFVGGAGTGKTIVAEYVALLFHRLGLSRLGHLVVAGRVDFVGRYIGHTAPKTKRVLERALGGVLFIDEVYNLYRPASQRDYGREVIELLLQFMENSRSDVVVIFAGYRSRVEGFFRCNGGIASRVVGYVDFPDYTRTELIQIARQECAGKQYNMTEEAEEVFSCFLEYKRNQLNFGNAWEVIGGVRRAILKQSYRLVEVFGSGGKITKYDLVTLTALDFGVY
jgi:replication-associated recombination protein RarA